MIDLEGVGRALLVRLKHYGGDLIKSLTVRTGKNILLKKTLFTGEKMFMLAKKYNKQNV